MKFFLITSALILAGCSSSRTVFDPPQKITGEIMVVGNEPFTRLAVRTAASEEYLISCDDKMEQTLLSHQGKIAELAYNEIDEKRSAKEIKIIGVKFYSK